MAAPTTCHELLDAMRESGILDESNLGSLLAKWENHPAADAQNLADDLQKSGVITRFQKDMLLQGKRRGYIIADKYILLDHIGAGGMGSVYLCQHKIMQRRVAIKVLPTAFAKDPEYLQRFHREARAAASLDHPNIVRAFDVDHDDKIHFLVMEFVDGSSLQDLVNREGPIDIRRAADYIAQAAAGLQHAHEAGLVHRDIKPGNLLVDRKGIVKVLDMGLALFFQEQGKSLTQQYDANAVLGTAEYLAPEQAVDSHGVDIRADIYSLGLTFYFLLTGKSPYGEEGTLAQKLLWHQMRAAKSVRDYRPDVPEGLAAIVSKMLAKNRDERYQTPAEVVEALTPWARGEVEPPKPRSGPRQNVAPDSPTTVRKPAAPPETLRDSDTKSGVRSRKKLQADSDSGRTRRNKSDSESRRKRPSRDDIFDDDEDTKEPRSSPKNRRGKAKKTSNTPIVLAIVGAALFLGIVIGGVVIWSMSGTPTQLPNQVAQTEPPPAPEKKPDEPPVEPPIEFEPPPRVVMVPPDEPKQDPPKDKPKVEPKQKEPEKKETPPKKETPKPPPKKETTPAKPPVKKIESLEDFFPKAGTTLFYDVADFTGTSPVVRREKWEFKDKGVIDAAFVKYGLLEGGSLLKGSSVKWTGTSTVKFQLHQRKSDTHLEIGQAAPKQAMPSAWDPVLPLSATEKDTWKVQLPTGDYKKYSIVRFEMHKASPAVVIRSTVPATAPFDGELVMQQTYVQGIGEISSVQTVEKTGAKTKVLAEKKLVEE